ncbi:MAG: N-acetylmuramoyl-L-alanine amidase [Candidatus Moranbacteria bacterium]|nr:N-acetylmuramoyl-L-alanine amidase [Candidatus Moranbacteria bacterium]
MKKKERRKIVLLSVVAIALVLLISLALLLISRTQTELKSTDNSKEYLTHQENVEELPVVPEDKLEGEKLNEDEKENETAAENKQQPEASNLPDSQKSETEPDSSEKDSFINSKPVSWGHQKISKRDIDTIVIHSSYDALGNEPYDLDGLLEVYRQYAVAPHFVIDREGRAYQLVEPSDLAYHAGAGEMPDGRQSINAFSIGVELMNTKTDEYTDKQYKNLNKLLSLLEENHDIDYILGHEDIAPGRKTDPWNFDWSKVESESSIHK